MRSQTTERVVGKRYRLGGVLGEGGMARVYAAFDERLERAVAVKILHRATEALPGMRQRFEQEARIAARLVHPYIVAVLDYGEDHDACYLVMERLPGSTLRDEMARGPIPTRRAVLVTMETLTALEAAHRYGVLHRDIKPSNILHQDDGHTKIADFGIAKSLDLRALMHSVPDDMTQTGMVLGTPGYLAPERRVGAPASVRSDLYAVGAVMVEALTGTRPGLEGVNVEPVPSPLREVAAKAVAPDPEARFASAEQMLQALATLQRDRPPVPLVLTSSAPTTLPLAATQPMTSTPGPLQGDTGTHTKALPFPPQPAAALTHAQRRHRHRLMAVAIAGLVLAAVLGLAAALASTGGRGPARIVAAPATQRTVHTNSVHTHDTAGSQDPVGAQLRAEAATLSAGSQPGDALMAQALDAAAAQRARASRVAVAQEALALAKVLHASHEITSTDYQNAVSALQAPGPAVRAATNAAAADSNPGATPAPGKARI